MYRPALIAHTTTRFLNRKYNLDTTDSRAVLVVDPDRRGMVRWEEYPRLELDEGQLDRAALSQVRFAAVDAPLTDVKLMTAISKDFLDWVFRNTMAIVTANEDLGVFAGPEVTQAEFRRLCSEAAKKALDLEATKLEEVYAKKIAVIQDKLDREQSELDQDEADYSQRKMDELGTGVETVLSLFGKRKRSVSKNLTKRRMTSTAKADVDESKKMIAGYKKQIEALEKEKEQAVAEVEKRWGEIASQSSEIKILPLKKDVLLDFFGVAWMPYYQIQAGADQFELPGFAAG